MPRVVRFSLEAVDEAGRIVKSGGAVIYPTDTLYGLGCNPFDSKAVERVYRLKGRVGKPLPVLSSSLGNVLRVAILDEPALQLAYSYWPGQLTLVTRARPEIVGVLTAGRESVGVRIPASIQALEIIEASGGLLVGTSANPSGAPAPRRLEELDSRLAEAVDLVIDGGPCRFGRPSTVVEVVRGSLRVLREGAVEVEELRKWAEEHGLTLNI